MPNLDYMMCVVGQSSQIDNCHGFVILLLVFHIITSCTARVIKGLILQFHGLTTFQILASQKRRTIYPRGSHGQRRKVCQEITGSKSDLALWSLSHCQAEAWMCFQAMCLHSSRPFGFGKDRKSTRLNSSHPH